MWLRLSPLKLCVPGGPVARVFVLWSLPRVVTINATPTAMSTARTPYGSQCLWLGGPRRAPLVARRSDFWALGVTGALLTQRSCLALEASNRLFHLIEAHVHLERDFPEPDDAVFVDEPEGVRGEGAHAPGKVVDAE